LFRSERFVLPLRRIYTDILMITKGEALLLQEI